jgi:hypothetical protein
VGGVHELRAIGDQRFIVYVLRRLYHVAEARGESRRALELFRPADAMRRTLGPRLSPSNHAADQRLLASLRRHMTEAEFVDAYVTGEALSLDQILTDDAVVSEARRSGR